VEVLDSSRTDTKNSKKRLKILSKSSSKKILKLLKKRKEKKYKKLIKFSR